MPSAIAYVRLQEALRKPCCPLCHILKEAGLRYLENLLYENVNDPGIRKMLDSSWGFCERHTRALASLTQYSLGIAIINESLLNKVLKLFKETVRLDFFKHSSKYFSKKSKARVRTGAELATLLNPTVGCPACEVEDHTIETVLDELNYQLARGDSNITSLYHSSPGLCLPHLRRALSQGGDPAGIRALIELHIQKLEELQSELNEYIRKHDYRYSAEPWGREKDSWLRSLQFLGGGIF